MNRLGACASLYLKQHAANPVHWWPWCDEAWQEAKHRNVPVIISIGYSACHWCHVMERQVFEDEDCAAMMNRNFVCIKVDREEHPDVDSVYMDALHLMGRQGGWPLNMIALPNRLPIYGGTYFPPENWMHLLRQLVDVHQNESEQAAEYAQRVSTALAEMNAPHPTEILSEEKLKELIENWQKAWDTNEGGFGRAPKFPMPISLELLNHPACDCVRSAADSHLKLTLAKMACGGIYDHVGGGFARYSVDGEWHVPHFEKMLYDNAQLLGIYAREMNDYPQYKCVVESTLSWLEREMTMSNGLYAAALDADTDHEEGGYYVWQKEELVSALSESSQEFCERFDASEEGNWEHGKNVLRKKNNDEQHILDKEIERVHYYAWEKKALHELLLLRGHRTQPARDPKCLTVWNAMCVKSVVMAYRQTIDLRLLNRAVELYDSLRAAIISGERVYHGVIKNQIIERELADNYIWMASAALVLFEETSHAIYLQHIRSYLHVVKTEFCSADLSRLFTTRESEAVLVRKMEYNDDVIPCAGSVMTRLLLRLSQIFPEENYRSWGQQILQGVSNEIRYAGSSANWVMAIHEFHRPGRCILIVGPDSHSWKQRLHGTWQETDACLASTNESELPLMKGKSLAHTAAYVCRHGACSLPVTSIKELLHFLQQ
jgi:uncharacterized protein YyaL (SSP411 family)